MAALAEGDRGGGKGGRLPEPEHRGVARESRGQEGRLTPLPFMPLAILVVAALMLVGGTGGAKR